VVRGRAVVGSEDRRSETCEAVEVERPDTRALWEANAPVWIELSRAGFDVFRDLVNTPAFLRLLPSVAGLQVLDLACGEGHNTRLLADRGADVVALDISERFIRAAASHTSSGIRFVIGDGAELPFVSESFDAVTAFMSLMDIAEPERTLQEIARVLRPGGLLQFSVLHPATSTPVRHWIHNGDGDREALAVGGYFYEGPLHETWTFGAAPAELRAAVRPFEITYARRTLSGWLNAVLATGLIISAIDEPCAAVTTAAAHPEVAGTRIVPHFLIIQAQRRT
jgi:SAM-dependent methyltransferase